MNPKHAMTVNPNQIEFITAENPEEAEALFRSMSHEERRKKPT